MFLQRVLFGVYIFSVSTLYTADLKKIDIKKSQNKLSAKRVLDGVLARLGSMTLSNGADYIDTRYAQESYDQKKSLCNAPQASQYPKSGVQRIIGIHCKDETLKSKQALLMFCFLPWCAQEIVLHDIGISTKETINKAVAMSVAGLFELHAECVHEPIDHLAELPFEARFMCSKEQLYAMRQIIFNQLIPSQDEKKFYDLAKDEYVPKLYELTVQEKELIITLPQQFMDNATFCHDVVVAEKQNAVKQSCKAGVALLLNQGRYKLMPFGRGALSVFSSECLRALILGVTIGRMSTSATGSVFGMNFVGTFMLKFMEDYLLVIDRPITLKNECSVKHHGLATFMGLIISIFDKVDCNKGQITLRQLFIPKKGDGLIGGVFAAGMAWDYYHYGVTYDCKPTTVTQLWLDRAKTKTKIASNPVLVAQSYDNGSKNL